MEKESARSVVSEKAKMKILTIQAAYFPMIGGAEVFHQKTAEWMVKQSHRVDVVTCTWDKPDVKWKNWQKAEEVINGVRIFRVKPWFYIQNLKSLGAIWPLYQSSLQLIKEKNYDLIHAHIFPALVLGALLKKKTGLPLVTTIQGGDVADYSETGSALGIVLKPPIGWCLRQADIVHTVSTHMERIVKRMGVKKTKVIPNGVDTSLFKPRNKRKLRAKYEIPNTKYVIISHSRLTPKNGLDISIKAIADLPNKERVLVLLVGGGEQEKELINLVKNLKLEKIVKFLGYKSREETAELLALSDLFVRPSREEGFGIAFIEAMASGLPVIGTNTDGITELVKDRRNGFLVPVDDIVSLSRAIEKAIRGKKFTQSLNPKFTWPKINKQLVDLYFSLLKDK